MYGYLMYIFANILNQIKPTQTLSRWTKYTVPDMLLPNLYYFKLNMTNMMLEKGKHKSRETLLS